MALVVLLRQTSAGILVGISAVIYALSFGAILFSGQLAPQIGVGIGLALVTATIGCLHGFVSQERSFISGPDSKIVAVMASIGGALGGLQLTPELTLELALAAMLLVSILSALLFMALARLRMANLVRFIPFSVQAGFLAATGWLMMSAGMNISAGVDLSFAGIQGLLAEPLKLQLGIAIAVAITIFTFREKMPLGGLIPLVMSVAVAVVHLILLNGWCASEGCKAADWYFGEISGIRWIPPWKIDLDFAEAAPLLEQVPAILVACFVGLMAVLLSVAALELTYQREFDMNRELDTHAIYALIATAAGGFVGVVSPGSTNLNKDAGGGSWSALVSAMVCLAVLLGANELIAVIPKPVLGGLIIFLGANLIKQWLLDQRKTTARHELAEVVLILVLIVCYGYLFGFIAGILVSCIVFVVTYSQLPLAGLATDLSLFSSSVVRSAQETMTLRKNGHRVLLFRLRGYVFFGSANKIEHLFAKVDPASTEGVIVDLSGASGIDRSALEVFQRMLRRYQDGSISFYFVITNEKADSLRMLSKSVSPRESLQFFDQLDPALEMAEDRLIGQHLQTARGEEWGGFGSESDRDLFFGYCRLRRVVAGESLCQAGDFSNEIYFVYSGAFDIVGRSTSGERLRLAKLSSGAMAGEMAFYSGEARTATIIATVDSEVYVLHRDALARMRKQHGDLATHFDEMVVRKVSESLRRTNSLLASLV